jgi:hypothetical protein
MKPQVLTLAAFERFEPETDLASDNSGGHWKYMTMRAHAITKRVRFTVRSLNNATAEHETLAEAIRDYNER